MRPLYQQQHLVSNDFCAIRAKNASEFRGAARGVAMSRTFCEFAQIFYNYRPRCADLSNYNKFAAFVQKRLDTRPRCGYNGAGQLQKIVVALLLAQTCCFEKNLVHTRKKDLTFLAFALKMARATPNASSSHYYWRPRAKIPEKSSDFVERVSRGTLPN